MRHFYKIGIVVGLIISLGSCSSVKIEKPLENYIEYPLSVKPSIISFNTQAKILDIQRELNQRFIGLIYEDNSLDNNGNDNVMVKAWKHGDFVLDMKGNVISYKVPLKVWIKAGFELSKFGIKLEDYRELNAALALKFKTTLTMNPDWSVSTVTVPDGYEWLDTPVVKLGSINFSVKFLADVIMQGSLKSLGTMIDKSVKEFLDFRPYVEKTWVTLNEPFKLNDDYNVWLQVKPQELMASPLTATKGTISLNSSIKASIEVIMGQKPVTPSPKVLPSLSIGPVPSTKATVNCYVNVPFGEINKQAIAYLVGRTFNQDKKKATIEDIKIYGSNGKLVAEARISGTVNGTLYFTGNPVYNPGDSTLIINNFEYDLSTKNFLVKSASWLYQEGFRKLIADQLKWSLAKDMIKINNILNQTFQSYKLKEGILLKGSISKLYPGEIRITSKGIMPEIIAEGNLEVTIASVK